MKRNLKRSRRGSLQSWVFVFFILSSILISGCVKATRSEQALYQLNLGKGNRALELIIREHHYPTTSSPEESCQMHVATINIINAIAAYNIAPPDPDRVVKKSYQYITRNCQNFRGKIRSAETLYGAYFLNTARPGRAIVHFKRSSNLAGNDLYIRMVNASNLAACYQAMGKYDLMDFYQEDSIRIGQEYFAKKRKHKFRGDEAIAWLTYKNILERRLHSLSWLGNPTGNLPEMHRLWQEIETITIQWGRTSNRYLAYRDAALAFAEVGDIEFAHTLFNAAHQDFAAKYADTLKWLNMTSNLFSFRDERAVHLDLQASEAKLLEAEEKYQQAAAVWEEWVESFRKDGERTLAAKDYRMAGLALERVENYDRAIEYLENSIQQYETARSSFALESRGRFLSGLTITAYWGLLRSYGNRYIRDGKELDFKGALRVAQMLRARQFGELLGIKNEKPVSLEQIQSRLGPKELLLNIFLTDRAIVIFDISSVHHDLHLMPYDHIGFNHLVVRAKSNLSQPGESKALIEDIQSISDIVLAPVQKRINQFEQLIVIPDGILNGIPFSVLTLAGDNYRPLVIDHKVSITPSISYLSKQRRTSQDYQTDTLLALADPFFGERDIPENYSDESITFYRRAVESLNLFTPLPETRQEIVNIASLFHPTNVRLLTGIEATETNLKSSGLDKFRYIHFATHGILGNQIPGIYEPAIVLSTEKDPSNLDGFLTLSEVEKLNLNCELTVLSACDTGSGEFFTGEGVMSLSRGFLIAGSRSVVVSLWPVHSQTTVKLMTLFYQNFRSGKSKAESLRLAQLALINSEDWRKFEVRGLKKTETGNLQTDPMHPYFWAPFVLIGE